MAGTMLEIFRDLAPGHALFQRFSFVAAEEFDDFRETLGRFDDGMAGESDRTRRSACLPLCRAAPSPRPARSCSTS